jgi:hypothetical protein
MNWIEAPNPFAMEGTWLKGALHAHTTESDGRFSPEELARIYRDLGYDFLCLTDHDRVTRLASRDGFLILPGIELAVASPRPGQCWHLVGLGADDSAVAAEKPASLDEMTARVKGASRLSVLAHPYWSSLSGADVCRLGDIDLIEVFNSGCEIEIGRGHAEYQWDVCLGAGRRMNAVAVDDCHGRDEIGMAWVMVRAAEKTSEAVLDALARGMFYSSCGPEIRDVRPGPDAMAVTTSPCRTISVIADAQAGGRFLDEETGGDIAAAAYGYRRWERYLRVQVTDALGRRAWSNPFYPEWPPKIEDVV